ncbi:MAG TPA: PAS domain-containing protein [Chloroflexi bacterium]|jgi:signal transduction histidine kinase|nr:PAS domain-containing protein [Chloroflexota bacterium]
MAICSSLDMAPWGAARPDTGPLSSHPLDVLSQLAATQTAVHPAEIASAWLAQAAIRLPVRALYLAVQSADETLFWSHPGEGAPADAVRQLEATIASGEASITALHGASDASVVRFTVPISDGARTIGALAADVASSAAEQVRGALEVLRWPLGLRLASLLHDTAQSHEAPPSAWETLWQSIARAETLTEVMYHLLSALPTLLSVPWATMATCDADGRLLHVTSLDAPAPLSPEAWAQVLSALGTHRPEDAASTHLITVATPDDPTYAIALRNDRVPLEHVLVVGGRGRALDPPTTARLEGVAELAGVRLARIIVAGERDLAHDAHTRVLRIARRLAAPGRGDGPDGQLLAVMHGILQETPEVLAGALHVCQGTGFARLQTVGRVPRPLRRRAGSTWWQGRLRMALATHRPAWWSLPAGCDAGSLLLTVPIAIDGTPGAIGVLSLIVSSAEALALIAHAAAPLCAAIIGPLVQRLEQSGAPAVAPSEPSPHALPSLEDQCTLEALLEGFPEGLFVVDRNLRVLLSNDVQASRARQAEAVTGRYCWELFGCEGGVCPGCRVMDTLNKGVSTRRRLRVRRPGRSEREWEVATYPIMRRSTRSPQMVLVIVRDITEQERLAQSLAQVEKLAALGRLAAGIAHEIKNPLAAVHANVQLLLSADPVEEQMESLKIMRRATERARRVVNNLLSFSDQSLGYLAPVDVNATIRSALDLVAPQCATGGVTLECSLAESLLPVLGSQEQLESVWLNLALNALDAVLEGATPGHIVVTSEALADGQIRVSFCDNGPGIAPSRLPHVFEPFGSNTPPTVGTGLGLYSCHNVVKRHGGTIRAQSSERGGSCFEVLLPTIAGAGDEALPSTEVASTVTVDAT